MGLENLVGQRVQEEPFRSPGCEVAEFFWLRFLLAKIQSGQKVVEHRVLVPTTEGFVKAVALRKGAPSAMSLFSSPLGDPTFLVTQSEGGALDGTILHHETRDVLRPWNAAINYAGKFREVLDIEFKHVGMKRSGSTLDDLYNLTGQLGVTLGDTFSKHVEMYSSRLEAKLRNK